LSKYLKFASVFAVSALFFGLVVACGGDDDDDDTEGGETPAATATETQAAAATDTPETEATDTAEPEPGGPIELVAEGFAFSRGRIEVQAGVETTVELTNRDDGVSHSFHVMAGDVDDATPIFTPADGPMSLTFTIDTPGNYTFQCDVHPTTMSGALVVE